MGSDLSFSHGIHIYMYNVYLLLTFSLNCSFHTVIFIIVSCVMCIVKGEMFYVHLSDANKQIQFNSIRIEYFFSE